ncbi:MAG: TIGR03032 family protein, partial [Bacteroidota bacterium]
WFICTFSPNVPELLYQLKISLAISTYQAGKLVLISAPNPEELVQLPRTFANPMGIAIKGDQLALATQDEVILLKNIPDLAATYPQQPKTYDGLFIPRASFYVGYLDLHDLDFGQKGIWAVNTQFSCLCLINAQNSFNPIWKPPFISKIAPGDRCHLNGLALVNGKPKYVSALGSTDTPEGWRENKLKGGILMDVESNEFVLKDLAMPHSPRWIAGRLFMLISATGEVIKVNPQNGSYEVVNRLKGFVRGMAHYDDYLFVGLSKLRLNSSAFRDLPIAKESIMAGIVIIHLPSGSVVGQIKYESSVEEIYDVQVIPELRRPGILNTEKKIHKMAVVSPAGNFWAIPQSAQEPSNTG